MDHRYQQLTNGNGPGGALTIVESESVEILGESLDGSSGLFTTTSGPGTSGQLLINTEQLTIRDGGLVSSTTSGPGRGGQIIVNASELVELSGASNIRDLESALVSLTSGSGIAEDLSITTEQLLVQDSALISAGSLGTGTAADIEVNAGLVSVDDQGQILTEAASLDGGDIRFQIEDLLLLRRGARISTTAGTAFAGGNGGNITINIEDGFVVAVPSENSDITANAFTGNGGRVANRRYRNLWFNSP